MTESHHFQGMIKKEIVKSQIHLSLSNSLTNLDAWIMWKAMLALAQDMNIDRTRLKLEGESQFNSISKMSRRKWKCR